MIPKARFVNEAYMNTICGARKKFLNPFHGQRFSAFGEMAFSGVSEDERYVLRHRQDTKSAK